MGNETESKNNIFRTLFFLTLSALIIVICIGYRLWLNQNPPTGGQPSTSAAQSKPSPYHLVYEEHVIQYNDSDMQFFTNNLKYTIAQIPYDINNDGLIDVRDVKVYIANKLLQPNAYQVLNGQEIIIPYGSLQTPYFPKGTIVKIVYGVSN